MLLALFFVQVAKDVWKVLCNRVQKWKIVGEGLGFWCRCLADFRRFGNGIAERNGVSTWVQTGCAGLVMSDWVLLRNLAHCCCREPRINLLPWNLLRWRRPGEPGWCWWQWHSHRVRRGWKPVGLELSRATKVNVTIEISLVGGWKQRGTWQRKAVSGNGRYRETFSQLLSPSVAAIIEPGLKECRKNICQSLLHWRQVK